MVTDELTAPHSEVPVQDTLQSKASVQSLKSGEPSSASNVENHSEEETEIPAQIPEHDNVTLATRNDNNVEKPQDDDENCLRSADDTANLTEPLSSSASGLSPAPVPPISISGFDPRYNRPYEIDILYYQPDTYLVTNKPWDVRIDGNTSKCPTVESLLNARFPEHEKLYLLHQLDYVTSGVHVWGLNSAATGAAGKLFVSRDVRKTYSALVKGHVEQDSFVINQALVDNPNDPQKRVYVASDEQPGKACETHVEVLRRGYFHHAPVTHVKLSPVTGRRHQLRVHMQSIGHPIVGDYAYENPITEHAFRTMLHAWKLELPLDKAAPLRFEAPEPFADLVRDAPMDRPDLPERAAHIEFEDAAETSPTESTTESSPATTEEASPLVMNVEQAAVETAAFAGVPVPEYAFENELSAIQPADVVPDANESAAKSLETLEPAQPTEAEQVATPVEHQVASESQLKDEPIAQVPMILSVEEVQQAFTEQLDSEQGPKIASLPEYSGEANATAVASDFVDRAATDVHDVAVTPNETLVSIAEEIPARALMIPTVESAVHDHAAAEDVTSDAVEDTIENATVSADAEKPQLASVVVLDLEQVANDSTGQVADLPRFTLEDEVEAVQSDLDPSDAPSADDIKEVSVVEQDGEIQPHAAHEAVLPHLVTVQGVENDVDAIGEYGLEDEVVAVCSDYQEEKGVTPVPPVKASESGAVAAENRDVVQPHHHEDEPHAESQVFAMSDIKDGQTSQFLAEHVSNETPAYSLEEEVSAVCTDFAEAKPAATPARGIPAEEVAAKPESAVDQQSTVDEHLQLSYAYEQKWHDAATIAKFAAASVTDSITEAVHKVQETVAPVVQDTVADLSDKAEDAAAAVTDKAVEMVESAQAAVATVSESEAPFDSEAAQKTIDEHLNLSYAYEESWKVPHEEPVFSTFEKTVADLTDKAQDAVASVKDKAAEMVQSAQAAVTTASEPEVQFDSEEAQKTIDEHLNLSYAYEASWNVPREEPATSTLENTVAELSDKAQDAVAAFKDKATEMVESAQAAVTTTGTEREAPFNAEEAQKTIDEHLNLSYAYEESWNAPREEPATSTLENTVAELSDKAQDAVAAFKDKATEMVESAQAAITTTGTEREAPFNAEEAQKTIDEHLNLSYAYEESWNVPREEPVVPTVVADLGEKVENAVTAVKDKAAEMVESAQAAVANVSETVEDSIKERSATPEPVAVVAGDRSATPEPVTLTTSSLPAQGSVTPAKRSSEQVFEEPAIVPAKRGAEDVVPSAQLPSKKIATAEAVEDDKPNASLGVASVDKLVFEDEPHVIAPVESATKPAMETREVAPAAEPKHQEVDRSVEPIVAAEPAFHIALPSQKAHHTESLPQILKSVVEAIAPASEPVHEEATRSIEPAVDASPSVAEPVHEESAHSMDASVAEPAISVVPVSEHVASVSEPVHEESTAGDELALAIEPVVDEPANDAEPALNAHVSDEAAPVLEPVHDESARSIEPAVEELASVAEPGVDVASVSEEAAPVSESIHEEARSIEPAVEELASEAEPALYVAPVSEEVAPVSEPAESEPAHAEPAHDFVSAAEPAAHEEVARFVEPAAEESVSVAEPAVHQETARSAESALDEPISVEESVVHNHEDAARSVEPAVDESAGAAEPAFPLATISEEAATEVPEPVHEDATQSVEPVIESATAEEPALHVAPASEETAPVSEITEAAVPVSDEVAPVLEISEPVHEEAARSIEPAVESVSAEEPALHVAPASEETAPVSKIPEPAVPVSDEAAPAEISEPVHEEPARSIEPAVESVSAEEPAHHVAPARALEETAVSEVPEPAVPVGEEVAPVLDIPQPVESTNSAEPAYPLAPISEEAAPVLAIAEPVDEEALRSIEPAVVEPAVNEPPSEEAAPVSAMSEPVHEQAVRSVPPTLKETENDATVLEPLHEQIEPAAVTSSTPPTADVSKDATATADFIAAEKNDASAAEVVGSAPSVDERNVLPAGAPVSGESIQAPATAHVGVESPVHPIPIVATPIASDSAAEAPAPVTPESAQQSEATKKAQKGWCSIM